ncbi:MAG: galactosyltransferase-related protein [Bacteroidia bacterium]|nr:galactosyltransferase-related protein [Bacteroidia bacterium]
MLKSWIPNSVKFPLWWLFKSPQRAFGINTLFQDIRGVFIYLFRRYIYSVQPRNLSVCVGIYNRSEIFLKHFVPSLAACNHATLIELSVFDCGSNDIQNLEQEIKKIFPGKLLFRSEPIPFARSKAFNEAVKQSSHELIFLCDADFSLPQELVQLCSNFVAPKRFWFPIVFYLYKNMPEVYGKTHGEWMLWGGKGLVACMKQDFWNIGGLDEAYKTWGGEDEEFYLRCYANGLSVIRSRESQLLHHWHPSLNPKYKKLEMDKDIQIV